MMRLRNRLIPLLFAAVFVFSAEEASGQGQQQQATGSIAGQVTDQDGQRPLASVTVHVTGTGIGALTNATGRYVLLNVPARAVTLSIQSIGYRTETRSVTVAAGQRAVANFTLSSQAVALDEIVVTGTPGGTQRRALGNDVARVSTGNAAAQSAVPQTAQALLSGKATGVQVSLAAGEVGGGGTIKIRGTSSITLGSDPILFVDGVRVNNSAGGASGTRDSQGGNNARGMSRMNDFKPEDIESIEIIKGPAAATLYGTEASAGVIQIITKRGVQGTPTIEAQVRTGANFFMDPVGRLDWNYFINPTTGVLEKWHPVVSEREAGRPEWLQYGPIQDYQFSIRGGADRAKYYVAANHGYQEGYIDWNWFKDSSIRANIDMTLRENFTAAVSSSFAKSDRRSGMVPAPYSLPGSWPYGHPLRTQTRGFYAATPEQERDNIFNLTGNTRSTISVQFNHTPISWLKQRLVLGYDYTNELNDIIFKPLAEGSANPVFGALGLGDKRRENRRSTYTSFDYSMTSRNSVKPDLVSAASAGFQYYKKVDETDVLRGQNFPAPGLETIGAASVTTAGGTFIENASVGVYLQEQVEWRNKVFVTGAVRGDDNSAFGADYSAAVYPKFSGTWVLNEEKFWHVPVLNTFRLRTAWGKAGRQPSTFAAVTLYTPGTGPNSQPSLLPGSLGNPDLGPEVGQELEVGFDAGLFNDRIGTTFTIYNKSTKNALIDQDVASSTGFLGRKTVNLGEVSNKGIEFSVNAKAMQHRNRALEFGFNVATNHNKIVHLGNAVTSTSNIRNVEGYPINGHWYAYVESATWDPVTKKAINAMCRTDQGGVQPCSATGDADIIFSGRSSDPTFWGGLNSTLTLFQNIRLYGNVEFSGGNMIHYHGLGAAATVMQNTYGINGDPKNGVMPDPIVWMYARSPNPEFTRGDGYYMGTYKAGYARLRDLSASYTLPAFLAQKFKSNRMSFTLAARNLWFLWKEEPEKFGRLVADPEAGAGGQTGGTVMFFTPTSISAAIRATF